MKENISTSANKETILDRYQNVTVIGAGAIGLSWAALFLANGLKVTINDPRPDVEDAVEKGIAAATPALVSLGYDLSDYSNRLFFEKELSAAVADADIVQENAPENLAFKQNLYQSLEPFLKPNALVLSSSSALKATLTTATMKDPSRVLIGHPFNPPHLIPLVEVVPGEKTSQSVTADAVEFYKAVGKKPLVIHKEIRGFVANRLQAALFRESVYLVKEGVVTMEDLDDVVSSSIGLRWAVSGPFKVFTLGGGPEGLPHFIKHLGPGLEETWAALGNATFDEATVEILTAQVNASYGKVPYEQLEQERDAAQIALLKALAK